MTLGLGTKAVAMELKWVALEGPQEQILEPIEGQGDNCGSEIIQALSRDD